MAAATRIGGISFGVSMDTQKLNKGIKKSRTALGKFTKTMSASLVGVTKYGAALLGLAGAGGFGVLIKSQFAAIDSLAKVSDKLGVTTEAMAGLQHAAAITGVENATLEKSLVNLTKATSEATDGVGLGVRAFRKLGISAKELNKLSPDKQFLEVADAIAQMTNKQDQLTIATQLFGTRGASLINTLRLGRSGLMGMAAEADSLGLAISRIDAAKIEEANDSITRMQEAFVGVGRELAVSLAPAVASLADSVKELAKGGQLTDGLFGVNDIGLRETSAASSFAGYQQPHSGKTIAKKVSAQAQQDQFAAVGIGRLFDSIGNGLRDAQTGATAGLGKAMLEFIKLQGKASVFALNNKAEEPRRADARGASLERAGSAAAFRQRRRIEGANASKIPQKQLTALKSIDKRLEDFDSIQLTMADF